MARRNRNNPHLLRQKAEELERQRRELLAAAAALDKEREQREEARAGVEFRKLWRRWHRGVTQEEIQQTLFDVFGAPPTLSKRPNNQPGSTRTLSQKTDHGGESETTSRQSTSGPPRSGRAVGSPPLFGVGAEAR